MNPLRIIADPALARFSYRCFPAGCPRERTCCVGLAVVVSAREMKVIDSLMDELAQIVPRLRRGDGYEDVFGRDSEEWQIEPRDERGTCPFLFAKQGHALCAIHSLALRSEREVAAIKPRACRHWPLVLERAGATIRITIHPAAQAMGCVAPSAELPGQPSVLAAFQFEIAELQRLARG